MAERTVSFEIDKIENGIRLTGDTLPKPLYRPTQIRALKRFVLELGRLLRTTSHVTVTVTYHNGHQE